MSKIELYQSGFIAMAATVLVLAGTLARAARRWRVVVFHDAPGCPGHTTGKPVAACSQGRATRRNPV